jgi:hypothetical protein
MNEILLVFDSAYEPLGEIVCEGGALCSATLTSAGEELLGLHVSEWQIDGVPSLKDAINMTDHREEIVTRIVRVLRTDSGFAAACREWILARGFQVVTFGEDRIPAWEKLITLPLQPRERFAFALIASELSSEDYPAWVEKIDRSAAGVAAARS